VIGGVWPEWFGAGREKGCFELRRGMRNSGVLGGGGLRAGRGVGGDLVRIRRMEVEEGFKRGEISDQSKGRGV